MIRTEQLDSALIERPSPLLLLLDSSSCCSFSSFSLSFSGEIIKVTNVQLSLGQAVTFQPFSYKFTELSNPKAVYALVSDDDDDDDGGGGDDDDDDRCTLLFFFSISFFVFLTFSFFPFRVLLLLLLLFLSLFLSLLLHPTPCLVFLFVSLFVLSGWSAVFVVSVVCLLGSEL